MGIPLGMMSHEPPFCWLYTGKVTNYGNFLCIPQSSSRRPGPAPFLLALPGLISELRSDAQIFTGRVTHLKKRWQFCSAVAPHQGHWRIYDLGNDHGGMVNSRKGAPSRDRPLCWWVRWKNAVDVPCWNLRVFMFGIRWVMSGWLADLVTYLQIMFIDSVLYHCIMSLWMLNDVEQILKHRDEPCRYWFTLW